MVLPYLAYFWSLQLGPDRVKLACDDSPPPFIFLFVSVLFPFPGRNYYSLGRFTCNNNAAEIMFFYTPRVSYTCRGACVGGVTLSVMPGTWYTLGACGRSETWKRCSVSAYSGECNVLVGVCTGWCVYWCRYLSRLYWCIYNCSVCIVVYWYMYWCMYGYNICTG